MQVEVRQLDVDDVLGLGVQLFAPGYVKRPFGFFHQAIVALIVPPGVAPTPLALRVQITRIKVIRVEAVGVATEACVEMALPKSGNDRGSIEELDGCLEPDGVPRLLDHLDGLAGDGQSSC